MKLKLNENGKIDFDKYGNLHPGIYEVKMKDIERHFGFSPKRKILIEGLKKMLQALKDIGCLNFYLDGSFVTNKLEPSDFDACWEISPKIDFNKLDTKYPELKMFSPPRSEQKAKYLGEAFVASDNIQDRFGRVMPVLDFFQKDKYDRPKGILLIKL